ncbi:MAG: type IV toxin-antitoxin system AbiEi family antitoxin domain-containing protein [Treponema sp.]|nr:type IV toxin-antitoxin system AbiEi family antitoxin domain-containing protein [Treponema sp.]MBR5646797.1 type IV toxin-antitoxin system AbiEi family antitoxin domain-containing protein [Treponema sp.]
MKETSLLSTTKQIFSISELKEQGFSYYQISNLVKQGKLSRLNKTYYENLNYSDDTNDFYFVPAFVPSGIICLMSAAVYYNLTTYRPDSIDVAVTKRKKISTLPDFFNLTLHYYTDTKLSLGVQKITNNENSFLIFDIEKTVADIICARNKIGIEETKEVLINYLARSDKKINNLYRYAEKLRCLKTLKSYLEVLL